MPGIVVIDDNQDELDSIKRAFFEAGIPCLPIQYINNDPDNESGIDHVDISDWISPRIIVTDLNLTEIQNAKAVNLAGPLAKMFQKLSVKGPYLLCIWSKLEKDVADVIQVLEERHWNDITLPLQVSVISKTEFLSEAEKLKEKLKNLISENSLFDTLLNWEMRTSEAGRSAVAMLYSLAQDNNQSKSIEDRAGELRKILAAIGNEAIGLKNAADTPALAMECGLIPVLEDQVRSMSGAALDNKWTDAVPEIGTKQNIDDAVKSKLNTFYHVEEVLEDFPKDCRGVFVSINGKYLETEKNTEKFEKRIGRSIECLIHEEFLRRKGKAEGRALTEKARNETILGFLEISAACDYAQRKTKFPRYILGALIPAEFEELTSFTTSQGTKKDRAHDGVYRLPRIEVKGKTYIVKFSFKYQLGAQPDDNQWFGGSLFRVRDQILSAIIFNCSQYASRPGVISFL
ncbi:hypothetical protein A5892_06980 [Halotalea alkalilenta]|uniref:Response receiver domain-containing protein n=1 Tax=Halotalea alkalilenta TaxID=376489 RepID=A0A172YDA3_9GAMM|nr:hypothetical protein A5892_06980 [Halotalea alkalilenta]